MGESIFSLHAPLKHDHRKLKGIGANTHAQLDLHVVNTSNPHSVTKAQVLTGNLIVNADVASGAAIGASKLNLSLIDQNIALAPTRKLQMYDNSATPVLQDFLGIDYDATWGGDIQEVGDVSLIVHMPGYQLWKNSEGIIAYDPDRGFPQIMSFYYNAAPGVSYLELGNDNLGSASTSGVRLRTPLVDVSNSLSVGGYVSIADVAGNYLKIPALSTTQRDALTPANGMKIYNSTTNKFQCYENGAWKDEDTVPTHAALTSTHGVTGDVVGTTDVQELSGKTLDDPIIKDILATPVANRKISVSGGLLQATDLAGVEGRYLSKSSLEQITNADVANAAGISESKLSLNYATHVNTNDPTADEKGALAGTDGIPSGTNKYVTNSDSRNSNARTPISHGNEAHSVTFENQANKNAANGYPGLDADSHLVMPAAKKVRIYDQAATPVLHDALAMDASGNLLLGDGNQVKITGGTPGVGKVLTSDAGGLATWQAGSGAPEDGWLVSGETWTYASADDPTFTFTISGDKTSKYSPGMRIKLTQTTDKYFIITAVAYGAPNTTVTVYGGTDYDLVNAAITNPYYSTQKVPQGFPMNPLKWQVEVTDNLERIQANPEADIWYNLGSLSITLPIGVWDVCYAVSARNQRATAGNTNVFTTLSTTSNSESDSFLTALVFTDAGLYILISTVSKEKTLALASKTVYYLNAKTTVSSTLNVEFQGNWVPTIIRAVCAYL